MQNLKRLSNRAIVAEPIGHKYENDEGETYEIVDHYNEDEDRENPYGEKHIDVWAKADNNEEDTEDDIEMVEEKGVKQGPDFSDEDEVPGTHPDDELVKEPGLAKTTALQSDLVKLATLLDDNDLPEKADLVDDILIGNSEINKLASLADELDELNKPELANEVDQLLEGHIK